uniref:Timing of chlorophyll A/B binding protein 1 n=1 Tax=Kalanchoe fedtschenkoi TaxID=63787 RepID=A0A089WW79_KALFE|nr:timing of chlorophyll A/B binding protein 1 [Kalanchoe fedtschenkoi]
MESEMKVNKAGSSRYGGGGAEGSGGPDGSLIDRSKVRILLCEKDPESYQKVIHLLCRCSYQVTSVRSARQVIDALNAEGPDIDIVLMEADLPMAKGMKLLKHITRDESLQRIPVIMMSAVDEVSIVFKSLRLGAADFLVKPLRTNELLNLWTHMWRRRRLLGLVEKSILSSDAELIGSDLSNEDTNSATLLSEGRDDKISNNAEATHQECENPIDAYNTTATGGSASVAFTCNTSITVQNSGGVTDMQSADIYSLQGQGTNHNQTGPSFSCPKKSKLKIGNSSAFLTYVRSISKEDTLAKEKNSVRDGSLANDSSDSFPDSSSMERSYTPPVVSEPLQRQYTAEDEPLERPSCPANEPQGDMSGFNLHSAYQYFPTEMTNHMAMPYYPQFNQPFAQYPSYMPPVMVPFPAHYPTSICLQTGQMPNASPLPGAVTSHNAMASIPTNISKREAALIKFRRKRNERSFDKKIRYVNRKNLAERRPRVKGQFVSKLAGTSAMDTDGFSTPNYDQEDDDEEDDEESEPASQDSLAQNNHSDQC